MIFCIKAEFIQHSADHAVAVSPANQRIDGTLHCLLVGLAVQTGTEKGFDFFILIRIVFQDLFPVFLGNPLLDRKSVV